MISVITPVFNGADHIPRTLDSLAKQATSFEHIVMDACSTDDTLALVASFADRYALRVVSEPDEGLYDAVQKGFARSQGDILAWINAGDAYFPWTLHTVERIFAAYPSIEWITGLPCWLFEESGFFCSSPFAPVYFPSLIRRGWHDGCRLDFLQQESMFWRRSLWERSGGAEVLRGNGLRRGLASDYHLWRRFAAHSRLHTVCSPLAAFTVTRGQLSQTHRAVYYADMGVKEPVEKSNVWWMRLFRLYSTIQMRKCIHLTSLAKVRSSGSHS
jgi:cellulose synthase/poly-beta-1,6-N-acetylglucosamine synthase-like glycosyltransferase